ncbi:hypothetical protein IE53DRAFT_385739 [Violaceomyces palustris]|uniref:Uncharacterized protein n=1 Tax=Violaceomyces palustris TaxID=1673888 RepID=A0ACD0P196_9BASI|nr:hypothetical protein IE53DRAFT_385739 [Violaceomyces palustris]
MTSNSRSMSAIPNEELPILENLINIRNRLTALKKDSSEFIRSHDVQQLYQAVIKQVTKLNNVRDELQAQAESSSAFNNTGASTSADRGGQPPSEEDNSPLTQTNRVDTTLNDVFTLLSLFFLTIGRSRESPATFSQLGCMKQLLDHLSESGIYTEADLQPFSSRLSELRDIIRKDADEGKNPPQLTKLMMRKLEGCEKMLKSLEGTLSVLSVELVPIHQKLVAIRRQIAAAAAKPKPARAEIKLLQEELRKIDSKRVDGKFLGPGGSSVPAGQAILVGLLEECFEICHDITIRNDEVPMTLQPIYDRLTEIKSQLEHLVLTHRWTLRETDLWNYQVTLKEIDRLRVNGKFVDSEGKQPEGQLVLLYLLRRCYGLIYRLVASSEPISEELMPISNKLSTVSKCLKEVSKYGGPFTMRDLYPYRLALHQIDNMRSKVLDKDGNDTGVRKWLGRDGSVPEGQAILRAQYEEVEQTIEEMLNREDEDEDEDDDEWDGSSSEDGSVDDSAASDGAYAADAPSADVVRNAILAQTSFSAGSGFGDSSRAASSVMDALSPSRDESVGEVLPSSLPAPPPAREHEPLSHASTIKPHDVPVSSAAVPATPTSAACKGRDFREGTESGLSSRSPHAAIPATNTSSSLGNAAAASSVSSPPTSVASLSSNQASLPPRIFPSALDDPGQVIFATRAAAEQQLPPGAAPLAVPTPGRLEEVRNGVSGQDGMTTLVQGLKDAQLDASQTEADKKE